MTQGADHVSQMPLQRPYFGSSCCQSPPFATQHDGAMTGTMTGAMTVLRVDCAGPHGI
jgi:hypothetical protein